MPRGFLAATSAGPDPRAARRQLRRRRGRRGRGDGRRRAARSRASRSRSTSPSRWRRWSRHLVYFAGDRLTLKQARSGGLLIGGGWPARLDPVTGRPVVDPDSVRANLRAAIRVVPALRRRPARPDLARHRQRHRRLAPDPGRGPQGAGLLPQPVPLARLQRRTDRGQCRGRDDPGPGARGRHRTVRRRLVGRPCPDRLSRGRG